MSAPEQVIETLKREDPPALFRGELEAKLKRVGMSAGDLDQAIAELEASGAVLSMRYPAPDRHLEGLDLRVVALISGDSGEPAAMEAGENVWSDWLRQFLANHRCQ